MKEEDKHLLSDLKSAVQGTKEKLWNMSDELKEKDLKLIKEMKARRDLEERLEEQLVDIYQNTDVNNELREKLPMASRFDPLSAKRKPLSRGKLYQRSVTEDKRKRHGAEKSDSHESESESEGDYRQKHKKRRGVLDNTFPLSYPVFLPQMVAPQQHVVQYPYSTSTPQVLLPTTDHQHTPTAATVPLSSLEIHRPNASSTITSHEHQPFTINSNPDNKSMTNLIAELNASKELISKLRTRLSEVEQKLESTQVALAAKSVEAEAEMADRLTSLIEEIYAAQRERDHSTMARIRLANEERDDALKKVSQLQLQMESLTLVVSPGAKGTGIGGGEATATTGPAAIDKSMANLLSELRSSESVEISGELIEKVRANQNSKQQTKADELQAVLREKNETLFKCQMLENELQDARRKLHRYSIEKAQEKQLQAQLSSMKQERDTALERVRKLEDEAESLRAYYGLHKSLSREAMQRDQYNNTLEVIQGELNDKETLATNLERANAQLMVQMKAVIAEKKHLEQELEKSRHGVIGSKQEKEKLERVVNVLRRKMANLRSEDEEE